MGPERVNEEKVEAVDVRRALVGLLPYQLAVVLDPARFTWNCWARQTGKSFTFSLRRLLRGLRRRRNQIILSAGERQSREVMEKVRLPSGLVAGLARPARLLFAASRSDPG